MVAQYQRRKLNEVLPILRVDEIRQVRLELEFFDSSRRLEL